LKEVTPQLIKIGQQVITLPCMVQQSRILKLLESRKNYKLPPKRFSVESPYSKMKIPSLSLLKRVKLRIQREQAREDLKFEIMEQVLTN
jgi:hypothetical protein